jgi:ABC-type sugar transport system permease subunit
MSSALTSSATAVPQTALKAARSAQRRQIRTGLLFVSPWVLGFLAFFLYPFFATLYYSFTD